MTVGARCRWSGGVLPVERGSVARRRASLAALRLDAPRCRLFAGAIARVAGISGRDMPHDARNGAGALLRRRHFRPRHARKWQRIRDM